MSIDPAGITSIITYAPKLYDVKSDDDAGTATGQATGNAPRSDDLDVLEQRFSAMISGLTKQLAALERSFSQAMRDMMKGFHTAPKQLSSANAGALAGTIATVAKRHELDPALLSAVVGQESGFRQRAVSGAGAMGLMQLMPETARSLGVRDPFDAVQNLDGGAKYLRGLIDRYHGRLDLALAAYNAGPGAVDKYGGVPPYPETQAYVQNILTSYRSAALAS